jgi:hypothetical protein
MEDGQVGARHLGREALATGADHDRGLGSEPRQDGLGQGLVLAVRRERAGIGLADGEGVDPGLVPEARGQPQVAGPIRRLAQMGEADMDQHPRRWIGRQQGGEIVGLRGFPAGDGIGALERAVELVGALLVRLQPVAQAQGLARRVGEDRIVGVVAIAR